MNKLNKKFYVVISYNENEVENLIIGEASKFSVAEYDGHGQDWGSTNQDLYYFLPTKESAEMFAENMRKIYGVKKVKIDYPL